MEGAAVGDRTVVERSAMSVGARTGAGAVLRDAVIGDGAVVGAECELLDGVRVWPGVVLPDGALRFSSDA